MLIILFRVGLDKAACAGIGWVVGHGSRGRTGRLSVALPLPLEKLGVPPGVGLYPP